MMAQGASRFGLVSGIHGLLPAGRLHAESAELCENSAATRLRIAFDTLFPEGEEVLFHFRRPTLKKRQGIEPPLTGDSTGLLVQPQLLELPIERAECTETVKHMRI